MKSENYFNKKAAIYSRYRPSYSESSIQFLYDSGIIKRTDILADIGAGTGILTKQFLDYGNKIYAVEPNKEMRAIAKLNLAKYSNLQILDCTAEHISICDKKIDTIVVGQAFHWFDKNQFKKECNRILRQNGYIVLLWNRKTQNTIMEIERKNLRRQYTNIVDMYDNDWALREIAIKEFYRWFRSKIFDNPIINSYEEFIGRSLSDSRAPVYDTSIYMDYQIALGKYFEKYSVNERITISNETVVYWGKL